MLFKNKKVYLRNPNSTRPWQHVLEAVWGYLHLAAKLKFDKNLHGEAFNFGPDQKSNYSVLQIVNLIKKKFSKKYNFYNNCITEY